MTLNVGTLDRAFRFIAGLVLLALPLATNMPIFENGLYKYGAIIVGIVLVATAAMRFCPAYLIFGIKTCDE